MLGDTLLDAIAYCSEHGLPTRLVTNVHWAGDAGAAREMLQKLREVGLCKLNFSMDQFHAVWIPLNNLKTAWYTAKHMGFSTVLIATCEGPRTNITAEYIRSYVGDEDAVIIDRCDEGSEELPPPSTDGTRYLISKSSISRLGRGRRLRKEYLSGKLDYSSYPNSIYDGCGALFDPVTLDPDGTIGACCGIKTEGNSILSLNANTIFNATSRLSDETFQFLLLQAIKIIGPAILLRIASGRASIIEDLELQSACELLTTTQEYIDSLNDNWELLVELITNSHQLVNLLDVYAPNYFPRVQGSNGITYCI